MRCRETDDHISDKILFFLSANSIFSIFKKISVLQNNSRKLQGKMYFLNLSQLK